MLKKKDADMLVFEAKQVVARVEKMGDLFAPVLELKQRLPDLKGVAASVAEAKRRQFRWPPRRRDEPEKIRPRRTRKSRKSVAGTQAETQGIIPSAVRCAARRYFEICHASTFCRNLWMGVSELEA